MNPRKRTKQNLTLLIPILTLLLLLIPGCTKKESQKETKTAQEIAWMIDLNKALTLAQEQDKPLMIDFTATWCPPCQMMEDSTFSHPDVIQKAAAFVPVRIDVDKQGEIANRYNCNASRYGGIGIPNFLFLDKEGRELKHPIGYRGPDAFLSVMDSVLSMLE